MKIWEKGIGIEKIVEEFTVGKDRELDLQLVKYDLKASRAHAQMLEKTGLLTSDELKALEKSLDGMEKQAEQGEFVIEEDFEDMHSKIEYVLIQETGDAGKKIHTARSRNDQVLVCLHLYAKDELLTIRSKVRQLFETLLSLSEHNKDVIIPGYTHLQAAMPSSFGMWFGAYAESLIDDLYLCKAAYKIADQNPLGSAAGYGSSFPIDRTYTTEKLGFESLKYNSVAAQMSRGKLEKSLSYGIASLAGTLSKMCMDICLYMSQNFNFLSFPDSYTTGSSIMPHKKNPDLFELVRARCNRLQSLPVEISMIINNLPSGYHRDFQLLKESLLPAVNDLKSCLDILNDSMPKAEVNREAINDPKYDMIYTVEVLNKSVQDGVPFREAYRNVATSIKDGSYQPVKELNHVHEGSIGNLCTEEIVAKFDQFWET